MNPPKYASFSRTSEVDAASNELGSILIRSYRHLRTLRYNRTRCGWGTCRNKRRYIHHCWTRLGHDFSHFFLILYPLRHCGAAHQAEILGAACGAEMVDVEQIKKIVALIPCDITFNQHVCELVCGVNATDLNLGVQINPVKQPIQSNSVGPWNMPHCGTSTFDTHLSYCLIVLKDIQHSSGTRMRWIRWNVINVCWNNVGVLQLGWGYACLA